MKYINVLSRTGQYYRGERLFFYPHIFPKGKSNSFYVSCVVIFHLVFHLTISFPSLFHSCVAKRPGLSGRQLYGQFLGQYSGYCPPVERYYPTAPIEYFYAPNRCLNEVSL